MGVCAHPGDARGPLVGNGYQIRVVRPGWSLVQQQQPLGPRPLSLGARLLIYNYPAFICIYLYLPVFTCIYLILTNCRFYAGNHRGEVPSCARP